MKQRNRWKWFFIGLGVGALVLRWLAGTFPEQTEIYYSRGFFPALRWAWDYSLGFSPVPVLYLLVLGILGVKGWSWWKNRKTRKKQSFSWRFFSLLLSLGAWAGGLAGFFLLAWGINYGRIAIEQQLQLPKVAADSSLLRAEVELATRELAQARLWVPGVSSSRPVELGLPMPELEGRMRDLLGQTLLELNYPAPGRPRARQIIPAGFLIGWGASGVYLPFTGEGQVDAGVPELMLPPLIAHELAHAYGFGDEGTCSFLAYLACEKSEDPLIRYCGRLFYWREVAGEWYRFAPDEYIAWRGCLPPGIQADLEAIRKQREKYNPWFPKLTQWLYDRYLKTQGIPEGIKNYDRVVALVMSWRKSMIEGLSD